MTPLMNEQEAKARIEELSSELEKHNRLYYIDANPLVSDADYDQLYHQLLDVERQFPHLVTPNSPSQRVGGAPLDSFVQIRHRVPMLSIEDLHELRDEELEAGRQENPDLTREANLTTWFNRLAKLFPDSDTALTIEPKIDGVAVSILYENGDLIYAATRGDGETGDAGPHDHDVVAVLLHVAQLLGTGCAERLGQAVMLGSNVKIT